MAETSFPLLHRLFARKPKTRASAADTAGKTDGHTARHTVLATDEALRQRLLDSLHQTLDIHQLFARFVELLRQQLPCDSIEYSNDRALLYFHDGLPADCRLRYALTLEGNALGELVFSRELVFTRAEQARLEQWVAGLLPLLANAIKYEQAIKQSLYDALTGLRKSHYYFDTAPAEIERVRRYQYPFSLILVEIDDFQAVRRSLQGDDADALLKQIACRLRQTARDADIVLRHDKDRFLLLLPHTSLKTAVQAAQRIQRAVAGEMAAGGNTVDIRLSAGVVAAWAEDDADSLLQRADQALQHARLLGGGRVHMLQVEKQQQAQHQAERINPFANNGRMDS